MHHFLPSASVAQQPLEADLQEVLAVEVVEATLGAVVADLLVVVAQLEVVEQPQEVA